MKMIGETVGGTITRGVIWGAILSFTATCPFVGMLQVIFYLGDGIWALPFIVAVFGALAGGAHYEWLWDQAKKTND